MTRSAARLPEYGRCQVRVDRTRCIFRDGHPGLHVCVGTFGSKVPIRGAGPLPEEEWISAEAPGTADEPSEREVGKEARWDRAMVQRLLAEIRESGVTNSQDWMANLPRLRGGSAVR